MKKILFIIVFVLFLSPVAVYAEHAGASGSCSTWTCITGKPTIYNASTITTGHILKLSGTDIVDAEAGTDYLAPVGTGLKEKLTVAVFDNGASALTTSAKPFYAHIPYGATITEVMMICDTAESTLKFDIDRLTYTAGTLPSTSIIGTTIGPSNYETRLQAADITQWTSTALLTDDILKIFVQTSAATATWCSITLSGTR